MQFGPPALDWVGPLPQPALQSLFDPIYPPGDHSYWKAIYDPDNLFRINQNIRPA